MPLIEKLNQKIAATGGLIVSCQPVPESALDGPVITRLVHICQWFNDAMREVRNADTGH